MRAWVPSAPCAGAPRVVFGGAGMLFGCGRRVALRSCRGRVHADFDSFSCVCVGVHPAGPRRTASLETGRQSPRWVTSSSPQPDRQTLPKQPCCPVASCRATTPGPPPRRNRAPRFPRPPVFELPNDWTPPQTQGPQRIRHALLRNKMSASLRTCAHVHRFLRHSLHAISPRNRSSPRGAAQLLVELLKKVAAACF